MYNKMMSFLKEMLEGPVGQNEKTRDNILMIQECVKDKNKRKILFELLKDHERQIYIGELGNGFYDYDRRSEERYLAQQKYVAFSYRTLYEHEDEKNFWISLLTSPTFRPEINEIKNFKEYYIDNYSLYNHSFLKELEFLEDYI